MRGTFKIMIEVLHISKNYGKKSILQDITFKVSCGECVAIVGKNGCGKSTLLQIMAGIMKADNGRICYFGKEAGNNRKIYRKFCGYVPQDNPLLEELSVKDNLKLWGYQPGRGIMNPVEMFQLQELLDTPVSDLSGGMKRRVSIASALLESPPIILLDEPTTALDIYHKQSVNEWISTYKKKNGIIIMTTHDEGEITAADRCFVMTDGKLLEITDKESRMQQIRAYIMQEKP